jgi:hypothetical protein
MLKHVRALCEMSEQLQVCKLSYHCKTDRGTQLTRDNTTFSTRTKMFSMCRDQPGMPCSAGAYE